MAHIPLGYKIVDGCAVTDEPTVKQIKATYRYYFEGKSLVDAAEEAGFKMNHATVKRMLSNKFCVMRNLCIVACSLFFAVSTYSTVRCGL